MFSEIISELNRNINRCTNIFMTSNMQQFDQKPETDLNQTAQALLCCETDSVDSFCVWTDFISCKQS